LKSFNVESNFEEERDLDMYVGSYDAPVRDLKSYRLRLEELALLGFRSVGLAINWDEHPRDLSGEEKNAIGEIVENNDLEIRFHPDLANVQRVAQQENLELLACAQREMEPIVEWALELGAVAVCCDSMRNFYDETVAVFRLLVEMTRGTELKLGVENSQKGIINSPEKMNEAVERVGDERMGLLVDVGHINTTVTQGWNDCKSATEFLTSLQVPIWDTHIHNNDGASDGHLPLRDPVGTLDVREIVAGFHQIGYAGPLNFECARKTRPCSMGEMEEKIVADKAYLEQMVREVAESES